MTRKTPTLASVVMYGARRAFTSQAMANRVRRRCAKWPTESVVGSSADITPAGGEQPIPALCSQTRLAVEAPSFSAMRSAASTESAVAPGTRTMVTSIEANRRWMNRFVEFIHTADLTLAEELVSPETVLHVPGQPEPVRGPTGYVSVVMNLRRGLPDIQWTLEESIIEGDVIAARFSVRGTHLGTLFGVPATRKKVTFNGMAIYRLAGGKVVSEAASPDLLGLMKQLGVVLPR
jgi:predicted ester cyclase